ncbi:MAG: ABC transporter permease subunit, partial [Thermoanaerobaculia bacterium]
TGEWIEAVFFGGDFPNWLFSVAGERYDQRNSLVVGFAMGFAVIPIIFAISEDAFSNVPRNLVAGSLALGANRWQTVTRVVLPSASPGIFSAIMVGFGRAVGETMIVLMATGNTPIMDWNPFNGFRTLSANIAVEIPEAAQGGTLYRVLFLAALLLFIVTFLVNTAAELVRQRLRKRYAEL